MALPQEKEDELVKNAAPKPMNNAQEVDNNAFVKNESLNVKEQECVAYRIVNHENTPEGPMSQVRWNGFKPEDDTCRAKS